MSFHGMKNPTGGVHMELVIEPPDPNTFIIQPWSDKLCETPGADPRAGWCGVLGRKTPGYPIMPSWIK